MEDEKHSVNEEQNLAAPSGQITKDNLLSAELKNVKRESIWLRGPNRPFSMNDSPVSEHKQYDDDVEYRALTTSACRGCGGPHDFDTSVPSAAWNRVIRAQGLPEYLCTTCIVREFVRVGEGFTAQLWNEEFYGVNIEVVVNGQNAKDAALVSDENTAYRVRIEQLEAALGEAVQAIMSGRLISVGSLKNTYSSQVAVKDAVRWGKVLVNAQATESSVASHSHND